MTEAVVNAVALSKRFHDGVIDVAVLDDVSISVASGETVAILGASGSGKSTLLHLLGGLDIPNAGTVMICGQDLSALSDDARGALRNRQLGFVYQFHHLLAEFTALENVAMPLLIGGEDVANARIRAQACLAQVGLAQRLEHRPAELSGGERQRTAIARALVTRPRCVLADEPTGNLDRASAEQALESMMTLRETVASALVVVTHDEKIASAMDRVMVLEDGRLRSRKD